MPGLGGAPKLAGFYHYFTSQPAAALRALMDIPLDDIDEDETQRAWQMPEMHFKLSADQFAEYLSSTNQGTSTAAASTPGPTRKKNAQQAESSNRIARAQAAELRTKKEFLTTMQNSHADITDLLTRNPLIAIECLDELADFCLKKTGGAIPQFIAAMEKVRLPLTVVQKRSTSCNRERFDAIAQTLFLTHWNWMSVPMEEVMKREIYHRYGTTDAVLKAWFKKEVLIFPALVAGASTKSNAQLLDVLHFYWTKLLRGKVADPLTVMQEACAEFDAPLAAERLLLLLLLMRAFYAKKGALADIHREITGFVEKRLPVSQVGLPHLMTEALLLLGVDHLAFTHDSVLPEIGRDADNCLMIHLAAAQLASDRASMWSLVKHDNSEGHRLAVTGSGNLTALHIACAVCKDAALLQEVIELLGAHCEKDAMGNRPIDYVRDPAIKRASSSLSLVDASSSLRPI